jgi:hypothetical protein
MDEGQKGVMVWDRGKGMTKTDADGVSVGVGAAR